MTYVAKPAPRADEESPGVDRPVADGGYGAVFQSAWRKHVCFDRGTPDFPFVEVAVPKHEIVNRGYEPAVANHFKQGHSTFEAAVLLTVVPRSPVLHDAHRIVGEESMRHLQWPEYSLLGELRQRLVCDPLHHHPKKQIARVAIAPLLTGREGQVLLAREIRQEILLAKVILLSQTHQ